MDDSSNPLLGCFTVLIVFAVLTAINYIVIGIISNLLGSPIHYWSDDFHSFLFFIILAVIEIKLIYRYKPIAKILNSIRNYLKD